MGALRNIIGRAVQCIAALALMTAAAPLAIVIALAVKATSRGPVLFRGRRLGRGGRPFGMLKFRTMTATAEEDLPAMLEASSCHADEWRAGVKLTADPRVTPFGRILRKTSLDELPQLWNVLTGDMNLIGPRPITEDERARYGADFELVSGVKPGITGLWQVSGRNDLSYGERVRLDVLYVREHTAAMDFRILCKTVVEILSAHGK